MILPIFLAMLPLMLTAATGYYATFAPTDTLSSGQIQSLVYVAYHLLAGAAFTWVKWGKCLNVRPDGKFFLVGSLFWAAGVAYDIPFLSLWAAISFMGPLLKWIFKVNYDQ